MIKTNISTQTPTPAPFVSIISALLILMFANVASAATSGHYEYTPNGDGTCTITNYIGHDDDVTIPSSLDGLTVTVIGDYAFYDHLGYPENVAIGDNVNRIGNYAFASCNSLTSVFIGSGVTVIGNGAFAFCISLTDIAVHQNNSAYSSLEGALLNKDQTELIQCPGGKLGVYVVPNNVNSIRQQAFGNCAGLTGIVATSANLAFSSVEGVLFNKDQTELIRHPVAKEGDNYTISDSVKVIRDYAFNNCWVLKGTMTIPDNVTIIGNFAFNACDALTDLTIGSNVTIIGTAAFANCFGLTSSLVIPEGVTNINDYVFYRCEGLTGDLIIPEGVTNIGDRAFYQCYGLSGPLTIPDGVTNIGDQAFCQCFGLSGSLTIPDGITNIGDQAFGYCSDLTGTLVIPNSVNTIGDGAFYRCTGLTGPVIGSSVTTIGTDAFYDCDNLTSVAIPSSVVTIGNQAFCACSRLADITVASDNPVYSSQGGVLFDKAQTTLIQYPGGSAGHYIIDNTVNTIGGMAFYSCFGLESIVVGDSVNHIGENAFSHCRKLSGLYFRGNAPNIGVSTFNNVYATVYYIPQTFGWDSTFGGLPTAPWPLSPADVDADYEVNLYDLSVLAAHWEQTGCNKFDNWCDWADFDQSGAVDPNDLILLSDDWLYGIMPF